jgi:CDP-diacylglycerol---serine O-phosphatidyltransferase
VARVWRRRRSLDQPRPAGRRWARLRQSGSRATQVFARVTRRHRRPAASLLAQGEQVVYPDRTRRRMGARRASPPASRPTLPVPVSAPPGMRAEAPRPAFPGISPVSGSPVSTNPVSTSPVSGGAGSRVGARTIPLLPGDRTAARRAKFALANGCTLASLATGMVAIGLAINAEFAFAAATLLACVVLDGFDGGLARRFGVASPFGAQMDSLADLSSFGVATGIVVYQWLVSQGAQPALAAPACVLVAVCAAVRLARFNVSPKNGRFFAGVPTTMAAAVLALDILVGPQLPVTAQVGAVAIYAVAMVSSFPYASLPRVARLPLWLWVVPAIGAMISVPVTFAAMVGAYLVSGPVLWVYHRRAISPASA